MSDLESDGIERSTDAIVRLAGLTAQWKRCSRNVSQSLSLLTSPEPSSSNQEEIDEKMNDDGEILMIKEEFTVLKDINGKIANVLFALGCFDAMPPQLAHANSLQTKEPVKRVARNTLEDKSFLESIETKGEILHLEHTFLIVCGVGVFLWNATISLNFAMQHAELNLSSFIQQGLLVHAQGRAMIKFNPGSIVLNVLLARHLAFLLIIFAREFNKGI